MSKSILAGGDMKNIFNAPINFKSDKNHSRKNALYYGIAAVIIGLGLTQPPVEFRARILLVFPGAKH